MIITEKKSLSSILNALGNSRKVFILGCADCATLCSTGGETETEDMRLLLEKWGKEVTGVLVPHTPCHVQKIQRELRISKSEVDEADAVLVLACGAGVQSVSEALSKKKVMSGLNTLFLGNVKRHGWFDERCSLCGDCILNETAGICPITRCAKGLVNGPCGGSFHGKCEVVGDRDCAWALIYQRKLERGEMATLDKYQPMQDFEISIKPGMLDIRKETQDERALRIEGFKQQKLKFRKKFRTLIKQKEDELQKEKEIKDERPPLSRLQSALEKGEFVHTCEIIPPKGINVDETLRHALGLSSIMTAFSLNENPGAVMRVGSLSMSSLFVQKGMEPILHLTTRERNRLALQSELLGAYIQGIRNILCMTGDHQSVGDHREAKPVYDLDSVQLIRLAKALTRGRDYNGNQLNGSPNFYIGGVFNPNSDNPQMQIIKIRKKVEAGADFFITQAIFDMEIFKRFLELMDKENIKTRILAGIIPLKSEKMAEYMRKNIPGIIIPDSMVKRLEQTQDKVAVSLEITRNLIRECQGLVQGVHLMPIGWYHLAEQMLDVGGQKSERD